MIRHSFTFGATLLICLIALAFGQTANGPAATQPDSFDKAQLEAAYAHLAARQAAEVRTPPLKPDLTAVVARAIPEIEKAIESVRLKGLTDLQKQDAVAAALPGVNSKLAMLTVNEVDVVFVVDNVERIRAPNPTFRDNSLGHGPPINHGQSIQLRQGFPFEVTGRLAWPNEPVHTKDNLKSRLTALSPTNGRPMLVNPVSIFTTDAKVVDWTVGETHNIHGEVIGYSAFVGSNFGFLDHEQWNAGELMRVVGSVGSNGFDRNDILVRFVIVDSGSH